MSRWVIDHSVCDVGIAVPSGVHMVESAVRRRRRWLLRSFPASFLAFCVPMTFRFYVQTRPSSMQCLTVGGLRCCVVAAFDVDAYDHELATLLG
jgi:hypothetical protein